MQFYESYFKTLGWTFEISPYYIHERSLLIINPAFFYIKLFGNTSRSAVLNGVQLGCRFRHNVFFIFQSGPFHSSHRATSEK